MVCNPTPSLLTPFTDPRTVIVSRPQANISSKSAIVGRRKSQLLTTHDPIKKFAFRFPWFKYKEKDLKDIKYIQFLLEKENAMISLSY